MDASEAFAAAVVRHQAGDLAAAEQLYRTALQQSPTHSGALCNLGVLLVRQNRFDEAAQCYSACLAASPGYPDAHYNFGNLYRRVGQLQEAVTHYQACLAGHPQHAPAWFNVGLALAGLGDGAGAATAFRRSTEFEPQNAEAFGRLGDALLRIGDVAGGVDAFSRAVALRPDDPRGLNNLGLALANAGRATEAIPHLEAAIALNPSYAEAHNTLALACESLGRKDDAATHYREAVSLKPDYADAWSNLGTNLTEQGRIDEAIDALRQSLAVRPLAPPIHSNLLLTLNYSSNLTPEAITAEHVKWAELFAPPTPLPPTPADRSSTRRLKIGYVSADFRGHTVAGFIETLLSHHDRSQVHITAYANVVRPDETTTRLKSLVDDWRSLVGLTDDQAADLIRSDGIDVLIDLSGHTAGNRLLVLARRPAPVQCTLFGYPNTTGLKAIDFRITDEVSDPPGQTAHLYAEGLLRLPHLAWVYQPPADAPPVGPLPGRDRSTITFGCLNNAAKYSDVCLTTWAEILLTVPNSRIVLLAGQSRAGAERLLARFTTAGVAVERVQLVSRLPRKEYYETYQLFDLCLDPFPYNGGITTCDALWMGVPVLAVAGSSYVSRQGVAILTHAGLGEFVADSPGRLVRLARTWSEHRDVLQGIRAGLREQLARSPVADSAGYVRGLEATLRKVWEERANS